MKRSLVAAILAVTGVAAVVAVIALAPADLRPWLGPSPEPQPSGETAEHADRDGDHEASVTLSDEQVKESAIELVAVAGGDLQNHFLAPGTIVQDANHVARVSVRVLGTVAELKKGIGDKVEKGEVLAIIESREVADAKSEYLAALPTNELQQTLAARFKSLADTRALAENEYLRARLAAQDAQIRVNSARQKLFALGLSEAEITSLPQQDAQSMQKQELRAPIKGIVAERRVDLGALVGREGLESELFVIVNLDQVWVDLAVAPSDVAKVSERVEVSIKAAATGLAAKARVSFISPMLDQNTRSARVVASLDNGNHAWRPGTYITAEIPLNGPPAGILIPKPALQTIDNAPVVFVRDGDKFLARKIKPGREDDERIEVLSGLAAGDRIAVTNTFILKAELEKGAADHDH